ncbi:MAG: riboflavin synthase [Chloroflexi bacterium]|nr:riboflavin synthase [Chloroflexota bacterium]
MFTGLVEEVGTVRAIQRDALVTQAGRVLEGARAGDSIAVNGVCLTVVSIDGTSFKVNIMPETLQRTNLGSLRPGDRVNLERALKVGDRMGGHFVQGHIDATGRLVSYQPLEKAVLVRYRAPAPLMAYIVPQGFIAVDGVSLTVVEVEGNSFAVSLVEITQRTTNLAGRHPGDAVNIEVDILAKYVEKSLQRKQTGITEEFLLEHGFAK